MSGSLLPLSHKLDSVHPARVTVPAVVYPYRTVLEAIAYIFSERRKLLNAAKELGHMGAYELEPSNLLAQYTQLCDGMDTSIGSKADPFLLYPSEGQPPIARWWIEADEHGPRPRLQLEAPAEFRAKLNEIEQREADSTVH